MHCKRIIRKIEKRSFGLPSKTDRVEIQFHLSYCKSCRNYEKTSAVLDKMLQAMYSVARPMEFTTSEKNELIHKLNDSRNI
jgi:predicted anti-sigma-YlaC factor YlaD